MVLFITLCKVFLTFESVVEILNCDHSSESNQAVLSHGNIMLYKVVLTFESASKKRKCRHVIFIYL